MAEEQSSKGGLMLWGKRWVKLVGALLVLGVFAAIFDSCMQENLSKGCNEGKAEDCEELLNSASLTSLFDPETITNKDYKPKFVAKVKEKKAEAKERKERAALREINESLMVDCQYQLKRAMKDPDSFKVHNRDYENLRIEYSATNSFNARIRNVFDCKTGKSLR